MSPHCTQDRPAIRNSTQTGIRLLLVNKVAAAILLPAGFGRLGAERLFFAVAVGFDAAGINSGLDQRILHRVGATGAESQIVFGRPAFVAVALHGDVDGGMLLQELGVGLQSRLFAGTDIGLVVVEVNVLNILGKELLLGQARSRRLFGGGGAALTVTRAVASCVPPAPLATRWYVVEAAGATWREPLVSTGPMPSMLTSVAFVVCQVRVVESPALMVFGFAASDAVGGCAEGGAGGAGGATFFAQAPRNMIVPSANTSRPHILICCFTDSSKFSVRPDCGMHCGIRG